MLIYLDIHIIAWLYYSIFLKSLQSFYVVKNAFFIALSGKKSSRKNPAALILFAR